MSPTTTAKIDRKQNGYQLPKEVTDRISYAAFRRRTNRSRIVEDLVLKYLPPVPADLEEEADGTDRAAG